MSGVTAFIRRCLDAGMPLEMALVAGDQLEARPTKVRSKGAERQARYEERKRQKSSENDKPDASDKPDAVLSEQKVSPKPLSKTQPISPTLSPLTGAHGSSKYEDFWRRYPNKVGKRAAEQAFAKALRRDSFERIMDGLGRAPRCEKWKAGYIPNPATWLNQDRWLDEPDGPTISQRPELTQAEKDAHDAKILGKIHAVTNLADQIAGHSHFPTPGRNGAGLRA